ELVPSRSHLAERGARWAEPDVDHLRELLRYHVRHRGGAEIRAKADTARKQVCAQLRWERSAAAAVEFIETGRRQTPSLGLGMVTPWGKRCGIAEYAKYLLDSISGLDVQRVVFCDTASPPAPASVACWKPDDPAPPRALFEAAVHHRVHVLHVQAHPAFLRPQ